MLTLVDPRGAADRALVVAAWVVLLTCSLLPRVMLQEVFRVQFSEEVRTLAAASAVGVGLLVATAWPRLRPLRPLLVVLGVLIAAEWSVFGVVEKVLGVVGALQADPSFGTHMLAEQVLRLMVTVVVIGALLALRSRPSRFFLALGNLRAPMAPIPWLGLKEGLPWSRFGPMAALALSGGTLVFLTAAGRPAPELIARVVPALPVVFLAAALNAFSEEVSYKASLLCVLERPVGGRQALLMVGAYFGVGHYSGVPYGVLGVAMAFALAWVLGRAMLETRGLFWAWFLHLWQDVLIFSFLVMGSITPGG